MDESTTADVDAGVAVKAASEKKRKHDEKQQALNNMFAKRPKSEGNNTTMAGIMDVQILVKPLPMTQRERENNKHSQRSLDGCKVLQGMIHDLDAGLETMRSFDAYEEYLTNKVVPLISGHFEELDNDSAGMLQLFFCVHGMAV